MAHPPIGRAVRRLRQERKLTQASLALRLGISPSYLNLIEHDQRPVTASLLIKLGRTLDVDLEALSGSEERSLVTQLREALSDPQLGGEPVGDDALLAIAAHPAAARAVLGMSRALAAAREGEGSILLPSGRRLRLPHDEARALFAEHGNHFPALEQAAEAVRGLLAGGNGPQGPHAQIAQAEINHAIAQRLRGTHGLVVRVVPMPDASRSYDPQARLLLLSDLLPRESRGFHMGFQLMRLEAAAAVDQLLASTQPSSLEAASLIRIGLLNYAAAALLMPYAGFLHEAVALRYDVDLLAARFAVSWEQAAQRLSTLQRPGARGVPFFFLRMDAAGNITKAFAGGGFPLAQTNQSCPVWVANTAFSNAAGVNVQIGEFASGARFLCFARVLAARSTGWGEVTPRHVIALGCDVQHAPDIVYADGIDIAHAATPIGTACRLCDWTECRSRAFPPLGHRLPLAEAGSF